MLNYRMISRISGASLQQLVRYARALFGEGETGGRSLERKFAIGDAFLLYFQYLLVEGCRLKINDASTHVRIVFENLRRMGLKPSLKWVNGRMPYVVIRIHPDKIYEFRTYPEGGFKEEDITSEPAPEEPRISKIRVKEEYEISWYPISCYFPAPKYGPIYEIPISAHIAKFLGLYAALS